MKTFQISCESFHYNYLYPNLMYLASIQHFLYNNLTGEGIHFLSWTFTSIFVSIFTSIPFADLSFFFYFVIFWNRDIRRITFLIFEYNVNPLFLNNLTNLFVLSLGVHMVVSETELHIKFIIFYGDGWDLA